MTTATVIQVRPGGEVQCLYQEGIDLACLGAPRIKRASKVEYNNRRHKWQVTIRGEGRAAFTTRGAALAWEKLYFNRELLTGRT